MINTHHIIVLVENVGSSCHLEYEHPMYLLMFCHSFTSWATLYFCIIISMKLFSHSVNVVDIVMVVD